MDPVSERVGVLRRRGLSRRQVDALPTVPGLSGLRLVRQDSGDPRLPRIHAAVAAAPAGAVLAGWAAAVLHGVPGTFLDGTVDGTALRPVDFCVPRSSGDWQRQGLRLRRSHVGETHRTYAMGVCLTTPERTVLDLARWSRSSGRRLAMLDLALRHDLVDRERFGEFLDPLAGYHGLSAVRALLPLASSRAESVPESELRAVWLGCSDIPPPLVNVPVFDRRGRFVGRPDLLEVSSGLTAEYQGFWHRIDQQPTDDAARIERFTAMNMTVVQIWKQDVAAGVIAQKLHDGFRRASARDTRLDAWVCPRVAD